MKHFVGNCIDGPWRGRKVEQNNPYFKVAVAGPTWMRDPNEEVDPYVAVAQLWYVWVYSLGEWAIVDEGCAIRHPQRPLEWRYPEDVQAERNRAAAHAYGLRVT